MEKWFVFSVHPLPTVALAVRSKLSLKTCGPPELPASTGLPEDEDEDDEDDALELLLLLEDEDDEDEDEDASPLELEELLDEEASNGSPLVEDELVELDVPLPDDVPAPDDVPVTTSGCGAASA